jgi:hypothetical protein
MTQAVAEHRQNLPPLHALYMEQASARDEKVPSKRLSAMRQSVLNELEAMMGVQRSHMLTVRSLNTTDQLLDALQA